MLSMTTPEAFSIGDVIEDVDYIMASGTTLRGPARILTKEFSHFERDCCGSHRVYKYELAFQDKWKAEEED
jgi:hypothetical protein